MEWRSPEVFKKGVMKAYVDEYDDHALGILQEDSQNGFDAYPKGTRPNLMKIEFKYDANTRVFTYRDYGTTGMAHCLDCQWGIKPDTTPCTSQQCSWGCYHNLAYSGKTGFSLGSRGMGKSLRMEAGDKTIVRTTLPDGRSMASEWQVVMGDWKWRIAPEISSKLSSPGTEMVTSGIKDEVHLTLMDSDRVIKFLQNKWFRLIEQGSTIEYVLITGTNKKRMMIPSLKYPAIETPEQDKPTSLKKRTVVVRSQGKRLGELRNMELFLAKEPFKEEDPQNGIAIVKNGKQTITRYWSNQLPFDIPEKLRVRVFGHVDADCETEPFLNDAENSTHTGYQWTHPTFKAVRTELNKIVREFVQPFIKAGGERVTEQEQREAKELLVAVNAAIARTPELMVFGIRGKGPSGEIVIKQKTLPYISRVEPSNQRFNKGETLNLKAIVKNPLGKEIMARLDFDLFDPTPVIIRDGESWTLLRPGSVDEPSTAEATWTVPIDDSMIPGMYWIQTALLDKDEKPMLNDEGKENRMRSSVFIEQDPPVIRRRPRKGTGSHKDVDNTRGEEGEGGLAGLQWFKKEDLPDHEVIIEMARALAFANLHGRRYKFLRENSNKKKTPWLAVGEAIAEKLIQKKVEIDVEDGSESWSAEDVRTKLKEMDDLKTKFVRAFMEEIQ